MKKTSNQYLFQRKSQRGATLIEALVSLLLFSIGLLGIAGLVVSSLAQQKIAQSRSVGAVFAADIAENMRANVAGLAANGYLSTANGAAITTYQDAKTAIDLITSSMNDCDKNATTACTPTVMANNDYNNWLWSIKQTLPSGIGLIQPGLEPTARTITIAWDAKASSSVDARFAQTDSVNCPIGLALNTTQIPTFRCVTVPFMP